jgi:hypothetical protein
MFVIISKYLKSLEEVDIQHPNFSEGRLQARQRLGVYP